jgi:hypothetical protein
MPIPFAVIHVSTARTTGSKQYLLRSLPPMGRHLETLPDVHRELQRVAGVGCALLEAF